MAIIEFENGKRVEFEGIPTQADIEEVSASFEPQQERMVGVFGKVPESAYKAGERNIMGNIFERPHAAIRSALQGKGYAAGAINPTGVPTFQEAALDKYYSGDEKPSALKVAGGFGVSAAGMAADMATDPANLLMAIASESEMTRKGMQAIGKTKVGKAISKTINAPIRFGKSRDAVIKKNAQVYRDVLRPTKGEIQNLEIKSGKNIDDYYKLAAEEELIIKQSPDKKILVDDAVAKLQDRKAELNAQLSSALEKDPTPKFSLAEIGYKTTQKMKGKIKNDTEYKEAVDDVFKYIGDAIEARGNNLTGAQLNDFKQGMWSVSYDPLKPNANRVPREIGRVAKEMIEQGFKDQEIKAINHRLGEYLTLETLLKNAQGRVVKGGRLGGYVASTIGAIAGKDIPVVGPIVGARVGGKVAGYFNNPERITKGMRVPKATGGKIRPEVGKALQRYLTNTEGDFGVIRKILPKR